MLGNSEATYSFSARRGNLWLDSITSSGAQTIDFENGPPLWILELVRDPDDGNPDLCDFDVLPKDLPLSVGVTGVPQLGFTKLVATWGPAIVPGPTACNPVGTPPNDPQIRVIATFKLKDGEDTATAKIDVEILNHQQDDRTLWLTRFPRLAVADLDGNDDGSDRLAVGRMGGFLYGDPIDYEDDQTYWDPTDDTSFRLTKDPEHLINVVSSDSLEPGPMSLPVSVYYDLNAADPAESLGFYHANDDDDGHMKGIYWTSEPDLGDGAMLVETVQYPNTDIYAATSYTSPYNVQIAALDNGDWIGAAHKYRETWRSFGYYPGPVGATGNDVVSQGLKDHPMALWLDSGSGYCLDDPTSPFSFTDITTDLDDLSAFFLGTSSPAPGNGFPYVFLNRFPVDFPNEVTLAGYVPSQSATMIDVRAAIAHAELNNHATVIHTMTEKGFVTESDVGPPGIGICIDDGQGPLTFEEICGYCTGLDPAMLTMDTENALRRSPGGPATSAPCAAGMGDPGGSAVDWPGWFAALNADFADTLGATGGFGWSSPNPVAGWCFADWHDHEPGFGSFLAQGWIDMLQDTASQISAQPVTRTMETSVAFFSQEVGIQNTWNFDIGHDFNHFLGEPGDADSYFRYHEAPIWRIPMMPMVVDNAMYASVYWPRTLTLPYTDYAAVPETRFFEEFPAVTGALACWSMANRVLDYGSVVFLNNEGLSKTQTMVPLADVNNPGSDPTKNAANDMFRYYRGLKDFLEGPSPAPLIDYHNGSMERPPEITIDGVTESYVLDAATIDGVQELSTLSSAFGPNGFDLPGGTHDLDWSKYQPLKELIGLNLPQDCAVWMPVTPDADPSFLPSGMFRHHDGDSLALLVTNPWGVEHLDDQGVDPPVDMNPFTFDYASPTSSPSTAYAYRFTFDPADYEGFPTTYDVTLAVYDTDGQAIVQLYYPNRTGAVEFPGNLQPFQSAAWVFTQP